jgi:hypothetical protein
VEGGSLKNTIDKIQMMSMKLNTLFTILVVASFLVLPFAIQAQVPTTGLIAYYPFNGNSNDESGNSNNGTNNGVILTTDRFGVANKAYEFGVNRWVEVAGTSSLSLTNQATFSIWVYPTQFVEPFVALFQKSNTCPHAGGQWSGTMVLDGPRFFLSGANCTFIEPTFPNQFSLSIWTKLIKCNSKLIAVARPNFSQSRFQSR